MTDRDADDARPFWERKTLAEMTDREWESLCDGCGRCCLEKYQADDGPDLYGSDIGCKLLDPQTGGCCDYPNRLAREDKCFKLTPAVVADAQWLPPTCGYRRVLRREKLAWWHPLVSGDPATVQKAGISVVGRFIAPRLACAPEDHTVDWPFQDPTDRPDLFWTTAMFGGINASVPTPFGQDGRPDLGLMAEHCFWLLANGCHGVAVLDGTGEVASLAIAERIAVLKGLVGRGVPASKIVTGIGPASVEDAQRIAACAEERGIRGLIAAMPVPARATPADLVSPALVDLLQRIGSGLHLYISVAPTAPTQRACLAALDMLMTRLPGRLRGLRDESPGCTLGLQLLRRYPDVRFEIYAADDRIVARLVQLGGAGVIGGTTNLLGRLVRQTLTAPGPAATLQAQRSIDAVAKALGNRPPLASVKALLARHSENATWLRMRPPLRPLPPPDRAALFKAFDATGVRLRPVSPRIPADTTPSSLGSL
ncbi:MAG: YcgN family cysteine cluster protein [Proteobacteria bacterium]|nr:YcgN family cysteine cluster protein [Pseudomonadota bacterium]